MCFRLFNLFNYGFGVHGLISGHGLFHVDLALETYAAKDIVANLAKGFSKFIDLSTSWLGIQSTNGRQWTEYSIQHFEMK